MQCVAGSGLVGIFPSLVKSSQIILHMQRLSKQWVRAVYSVCLLASLLHNELQYILYNS